MWGGGEERGVRNFFLNDRVDGWWSLNLYIYILLKGEGVSLFTRIRVMHINCISLHSTF